ncbi:MAG: ABC transporter permease [Actinomycetes bacterium]
MTSSHELVRLIAGREISLKLRDKGFIASTVVFVAVILAAIVLPAVLAGGTPSYTLAVTDAARPVAEAAAALGAAEERPVGVPAAEITVVRADQPAALLDADGEDVPDAALHQEDGELVLTGVDGVPDEVVALVAAASASQTIQRVAGEAGLSDAQVRDLTAPAPPRIDLTDPRPDQAIPPEFVVLVFGFLFYYTVLTFGIAIAQSVVEEKSSRIVEILVAAVPVRWLLTGKVLGNTAMALGQVAVILGMGILGAQVIGEGEIVAQVIGVSGWFLAFLLVGFLMLACLWAVAGSLASRIEELQSTTLYMQLAVMVPFFSAIFVTDEGPLRVVLSYVPITAPLMMPARVATGDALAWEPWVALGVVAATAAVLIRVGARIYAGSVLETSRQTKAVAAWRRASR